MKNKINKNIISYSTNLIELIYIFAPEFETENNMKRKNRYTNCFNCLLA